MTPEEIARWSRIKGISVIGTGDFTHPLWIKELKEKLEPSGNGLLRLKKRHSTEGSDVLFMLTAEVSSIYSKNGRVRKVHSIILVPGFKEAEFINKNLSKIGNLSSDGRPILGLDPMRLLKIVLDASPDAMLIPAHAWTPHFSVFGAESGFDSLYECFEDLTPYIYAIETGLSSDPPMNRRLSDLDHLNLISNSDAHSPSKIGREANIFETEPSYFAMIKALRTGVGFGGTIEFYPEEGKYHLDGHRNCNVRMTPEETLRHNCICPVCGRRLTIGVLHRVEALADRKTPIEIKPFRYIIPLEEIIASIIGKGTGTKTVINEYLKLVKTFGSEFNVLIDTTFEDIARVSSMPIAQAVLNMRSGNVVISAGYDGVYGKIKTS